ncbi:hypothetical protein Q4I32_005485 [Leishmania shawi]|uniref:Uncharacterized protein n=1 Tax=Leishmania shawi TaxID=5680 RepID=A0AAW3BMT0_9TRYP
MSALVLSIGIPPQERARLCAVAAADVCQQAVAHVNAAAQCEMHNAAAPYIRAVYVYRAGSVAAERVTVASGSECGSYLQETLRVTVAGIEAPSVACWLTVTLEDTCIVQHAVFAITPNSKEPQKMASPALSQMYAPRRATPRGNVDPQRAETLAARVPALPSVGEANPPPSASHRRSLGAIPCSHSARNSSKAMEVAAQRPPVAQRRQQPPQQLTSPPQQQQQEPPPIRNVYKRIEKYQTEGAHGPDNRTHRSPRDAPQPKEDIAPPHLSQNSRDAAPRLGGPGNSASISHPSTAARPRPQSAVDHSTSAYPSSKTSHPAALARPNSRPLLSDESVEQLARRPSDASSTTVSQSSGCLQVPQSNADDLTYNCMRTDLTVASDRQQWGDWAPRICYSPRREELWELADACMTHDYRRENIDGDEPPCDESELSRSDEY